MTDDYRHSLEYLYGRLDYERLGMPRTESDLGLGRMRRLLRALDDPQDGLRIVHVAGTKGKGSTAFMIASAALAAGHRTGLFTSPHLDRLEERFRVDGAEASREDIIALVEAVRPAVERLDKGDPRFREVGATFFEITTAMGLLHFARCGVGLVVLEVGMGGRLDSTNAVSPVVSVLTSISYDHTRLLGSTLAAIAAEKAGIIKRGRPVVSGVRDAEPRAVIRKIAAARRSPLREIDVDFRYFYQPPQPPLTGPTPGSAQVSTWRTDWGIVKSSLLGEHQVLNASVALATIDVLDEQGFSIGHEPALRSLADLKWPARAEVLLERPWIVVVDGAHNAASASALADTLRTCFPQVSRTLIFGSSREKDFRAQLEALLPLSDRVICTRYTNNPRAVPPADVAEVVLDLGRPDVIVCDNPEKAWEVARSITPDSALICATGSLFLAAEMRSVVVGRSTKDV
jgi:dihydrofolate synthase / folylpolyglutamate synthase